MSKYVESYGNVFLALFSEERTEFKLSRWTVQAGKGAWLLENRRTVGADNLLVKRPGALAWTALRDAFEVNGTARA
jgi:hypothetical protein